MTSLIQFLKPLTAGANVVMSLTSLAAALSAMRWGRAAEPCVWVSNPFGNSVLASVTWNAILALSLGLTGALWLVTRGNRFANRATWRWTLCGVLLLLIGRAFYDSVTFARLVAAGEIISSFPLPLSAAVLAVLIADLILVGRDCRESDNAGAKPQANVFVLLTGMLLGQLLLILLHVLTFGSTDYRRLCDVAVVLGARVYPDGTLSLALSDRLQTAVDLFNSKQVRMVLVSGATGVEAVNEAHAMQRFLIEAGIPNDRILIDDKGANTLLTARNVRRIMNDERLSTALVVSHYFHLARCKMLFEEHGINCVTAPAHMSRRLAFEPYFVMRECAGYLWYVLTRPLRSPPLETT